MAWGRREAQVAPLLACSCAEAQGFLFGRPMPAREFEEQLRGAFVV